MAKKSLSLRQNDVTVKSVGGVWGYRRRDPVTAQQICFTVCRLPPQWLGNTHNHLPCSFVPGSAAPATSAAPAASAASHFQCCHLLQPILI